jgi:hypothetical protein
MHRIAFGVLLGWLSLSAMAHEMRPAIATLHVEADGVFELTLETNLEAWMAEVNPTLSDTNDSPRVSEYDRLRALSDDALAAEFTPAFSAFADAPEVRAEETRIQLTTVGLTVLAEPDPELPRDTRIQLVGALPDGADSLSYATGETLPDTAVRVYVGDAEPTVQYVRHGTTSDPFVLVAGVERSVSAIVWEYIVLGFTHIVPKGVDHIVFILGLTLISKRLIDLVIQVTAFTVAHSVTLAMGLYGVLTLPASIVEPLIAASIVFIAVENCVQTQVKRSRTLIVFGFGLLHGLGFASVLTELGLPARDFVVGLLAFNVGVELGQLLIIAMAYFAVGIWLLQAPWYRIRVAMPVSVLIGSLGVYWFVERVGWIS